MADSGGGRARGGRGEGGGALQTTNFEYGKDWTFGTPGAFGGRGGPTPESFDISGNLVFAGNGYVVNKDKTNPYEGLDVKGKIVVIAGLPAEIAAQQAAGRGGRRAAGQSPDPLGENCNGLLDPRRICRQERRAGGGQRGQLPAVDRHGESCRGRRRAGAPG